MLCEGIMNKFSLYLFLSTLLILFFSACARLPDYARPQFSPEDYTVSAVNSFAYRQLKVEDFRAPSLPPKFEQFNHSIQARSCISIQTSRNSQIQIASGTISGKIIYAGKFANISFISVFNPDCSWWNPKITPEKKNYILQHEQIHFALTELTARRLNRDYKDHMEQYTALGSTLAEVKNQLHAEAERVSRKGIEEALDEHTSFDEETSLFYDPEIQQEWSERVTRALTEEMQ
jgi:hypothetical protein